MRDQRLLELALMGLEAERSKIDQEIAALKSQISPAHGTTRRRRAGSAAGAEGRTASRRRAPARKRGGGLTPAGRKKLSEAAKRRWAENRKTGKTTL